LRRTYGFEEEEALAFWHLSGAHELMLELARAEDEKLDQVREREYDAEGLSPPRRAARDIGNMATFAAQVEARIAQHFEALYRVLGTRVL
jgi:hypothetical protein